MTDALAVDDLAVEVRRSARRKTPEIREARGGEVFLAAPSGRGRRGDDRLRTREAFLDLRQARRERRASAASVRQEGPGGGRVLPRRDVCRAHHANGVDAASDPVRIRRPADVHGADRGPWPGACASLRRGRRRSAFCRRPRQRVDCEPTREWRPRRSGCVDAAMGLDRRHRRRRSDPFHPGRAGRPASRRDSSGAWAYALSAPGAVDSRQNGRERPSGRTDLRERV